MYKENLWCADVPVSGSRPMLGPPSVPCRALHVSVLQLSPNTVDTQLGIGLPVNADSWRHTPELDSFHVQPAQTFSTPLGQWRS